MSEEEIKPELEGICTFCRGKGRVGGLSFRSGRGEVIEATCPECGGTGKRLIGIMEREEEDVD